jgi:hypothetical protein
MVIPVAPPFDEYAQKASREWGVPKHEGLSQLSHRYIGIWNLLKDIVQAWLCPAHPVHYVDFIQDNNSVVYMWDGEWSLSNMVVVTLISFITTSLINCNPICKCFNCDYVSFKLLSF